MSKQKKSIDRLLKRPNDFTWNELVKVLSALGYKETKCGKTGGSRSRFINPDYPPIMLHKPHPKPTLKRYQIDDIIHLLQQEKLL